ncbi:MAG: epoxyqueuosine reductase QueH [Treponema sp.]|nr:epoxyqueuosine reductase QueH [Treponema sp.]
MKGQIQKINYQKQLDEILKKINPQEKKPTLFLHACCGPCSSYVIEYLSSFFDITIFYYNPNIYPQKEYERRLNELKDFIPRFEPAVKNKVKIVVSSYEPKDFFEATNVLNEVELQQEAEKGIRCRRCYKFRMKKAYAYAIENNFDWFCTTLSISPFKDSVMINEIGAELEKENSVRFLTSDFKKKGGFLRSLELSKEYDLYRQDYCGCLYSKINTEKARQNK